MQNSNKKELISAIFKVLLLYEDVNDKNSEITNQDYIRYLNRLYIRFLGRNEIEIADTIKGLIIADINIPQRTIKSIVFHMIELIEKGIKTK